MATLRHAETREARPVPGRALVGRAASSTLRSEALHVSGEHASLDLPLEPREHACAVLTLTRARLEDAGASVASASIHPAPR